MNLSQWDGVQDWIVLSADKQPIGYVSAEAITDRERVVINYHAWAYTSRGRTRVGIFIKKEEAVTAIEKFGTGKT